jgi:carbon monoxide dehydrogenase subunit G
MPSDTFRRQVTVGYGPEQTWNTVTKIDHLVSWVPILSEAVEHEPLKRYSALLVDRLGPFSLKADLAIDVTDVVEHESITIRAEGHDRQVDSRILVEGTMQLRAKDPGTELEVQGRYEVTGRVATFGGPMIRSKADKVIEDFFSGLTQALR